MTTQPAIRSLASRYAYLVQRLPTQYLHVVAGRSLACTPTSLPSNFEYTTFRASGFKSGEATSAFHQPTEVAFMQIQSDSLRFKYTEAGEAGSE